MNRIYAGTAGGKRYFYGDGGKLYDEAGVEQPEAYANVLKANFPQPKASPSQGPTPQQAPIPDDYDPRSPRRKTITQAAAADILRIAFPDLYRTAKRYRTAMKKKDKKKKQYLGEKDKKKGKSKDGEQGDIGGKRKQWERELSLNIQDVASNIRSNGELLRQQLTMQERSLEFLEKIANGVGGKDDKEKDPNSTSGKIASRLGALKKFILPALGIAAVAGVGATALYMNSGTKTEDLQLPEEKEEAPQPSEPSAWNPKKIWDMADTRKPAERAAERRAKYGLPPPDNAPQPGDTKGIADARQRRPSGRNVEIKAEQLNFEAKTIKLEARTISISGGNNVPSGKIVNRGASAQDSSVTKQQQTSVNPQSDPTGRFKTDSQPTGPAPTLGGSRRNAGGNYRDAPGGGLIGPSTFNPNMETPSVAGTQGGKGAYTLGGSIPKTAESIEKNDIAPTEKFSGKALGGGPVAGINENATGTGDVVGKTNVAELQNNAPFQKAIGDFQKTYPNISTEDIYKTIKGESSFRTNVGPNSSGYAGLFQMNTKDIKLAGYKGDLASFIKEPAHVQLDHWKKMFQGQGFKADSLYSTGLANAAGSPKWQTAHGDTEIYKQGTAAWNANPGWRGPDGRITKDSIINYYNTRNALSKEEKKVLNDTLKPAKPINVADPNAKNTERMIGGDVGVGDLGSMFSKERLKNQKGLIGGESAKSEKPAEKIDEGLSEVQRLNGLHNADPLSEARAKGKSGYAIDPLEGPTGPQETAKTSKVQELLDTAKQKLGNLRDRMLAPQSQVDQMLKANKNPFVESTSNYKPLDKPIETPGEIPERDTDSSGVSAPGGGRGGADEFDEPNEKSQGSKAKVTDHVEGSKTPKPIRKVDVDKYYPQYKKSFGNDYGGSDVGIGVA